MEPTPQALATAEVCDILRVRPNTISRWVKREKITPLRKLPGRTGAYVFGPAEVERMRQLLNEEAS